MDFAKIVLVVAVLLAILAVVGAVVVLGQFGEAGRDAFGYLSEPLRSPYSLEPISEYSWVDVMAGFASRVFGGKVMFDGVLGDAGEARSITWGTLAVWIGGAVAVLLIWLTARLLIRVAGG